MRHLVIGLCAMTVACSGETPTAPSASLAPIGPVSSSADAPVTITATGAQPHFNLEAILRGEGFGLVKLRQEKDPTQDIIYMDVWVRDLLPNTSYGLQRAVYSARSTALGMASAPARTG
jgi:hypothetical protein